MKIAYSRMDLPEGKVKYNDERVSQLVDKHNPKKVTPFYAEFLKEDYIHGDVILIPEENLLDLIIMDMEKCEIRIHRSEDEVERQLMEKCSQSLEEEIPICDMDLDESELELLRKGQFVTLKPVLRVNGERDTNTLIEESLQKAGMVFFYTAGPKEVHAWPVTNGTDMVTCAGKIHSDLARGFIKGDIVNFNDYTECHNFNDARKKGLVKVVDRDHPIEDGDIIEIRFNV